MAKKDNLPLNLEQESSGVNTITYANEVIAIIAGVAANEVEGIAGMCTSGGFSDMIGKNRNITKGVRVEIGIEETSVDLFVIIEYGTPIQKAAQDAQDNVRKAIETMTGLHVVRVDVHVQGVSFEKENKALASGLQNAVLESASAEKLNPSKESGVHTQNDPEICDTVETI
jgi:uncharacterized alkaline shock family protein YloU